MTILEAAAGRRLVDGNPRAVREANKGEFYATAADLDDPALSESAQQGPRGFRRQVRRRRRLRQGEPRELGREGRAAAG